ncbi:MAG: cobalamin-dependent protein, partial [Candidatus Syntrophosphaera sp.]
MKRSDAPLKLLLIGMNSAWYQSNPALYYLRNAISDLDIDVRIIELILSEPLADVLARLYQEKAGAYCFSAYIWNREYLEKLIPELKKLLPEAHIVLGGPEAAQGNFGLSRGDHIVIGPGEGAFRKLAE